MNLAIASSTLPDAFPVQHVQFEQLKTAGMLEDLNDAYEQMASPSLRKMMDNNLDILETGKDETGALVGLPRLHYGFECMTNFIWMRNDWVEADGITQPETMDDLTAVMDTFMEKNGARYGMMLDKTLNAFYNLAPGFHSYPKRWIEGEDGTIVYGATLPETKVMLETWAKWYADGYIRSDFATLTEDAMREDAYNGNVGLIAKEQWAGWILGRDMTMNQGDESYFISFETPSIDGEKVMFPVEFPNVWYNVVRKGYEHPEAMVKLIDAYIYILNDSVADGSMTLEEVLPFATDDMHHITGPFKVEFVSYDDTKEVAYAVQNGGGPLSTGYAHLYHGEIMTWVNDGDPVGLGRWLQMGYDNSSLSRAVRHIDNEQILKDKIWGLKPQEVLDYGSTLEDLLTEGFTEIIMGVEDIDYYDTLIANWYTAGGQVCIDAVNAMYGK